MALRVNFVGIQIVSAVVMLLGTSQFRLTAAVFVMRAVRPLFIVELSPAFGAHFRFCTTAEPFAVRRSFLGQAPLTSEIWVAT